MGGSGSLVVGQSGGVTPVINGSLAGVIAEACAAAAIDRVYGMRNGVRGLRAGDLARLDTVDGRFLERLRATPGAWLGSCRYAPGEAELDELLERLAALDARCFIYIGGNDSAETSARLARRAAVRGSDLRVVNVPKTIDNDLPEMDHCPGYATAAAHVALSARLLYLDTHAMDHEEPLRVVEVKGRHSGWLAAAAGALLPGDDGPLCTLLPEEPLDEGAVLALAEGTLGRHGCAVLVVSEHAADAAGRPVGVQSVAYTDEFGHADSTGPGAYLSRLLEHQLGRRCRLDVLGALQKVALPLGTAPDGQEAFDAGRHAVRAALAGESGVCVTLLREPGAAYRVRFGLAPLERIARSERRLPPEFHHGHRPTPAFHAWLAPLLGDLYERAGELLADG